MKKNRILLIVFTVFFAMCMVYVFGQKPAMEECVKIIVQGENSVQTISLFRGEDGTYVGFLPAYAVPEKTFLQVKSNQRVLLNGTPVEAPVPMEAIRLREDYSLQFGEEQYTVVFMQSANVPAMFIETRTRSMHRVDKNKATKEKINAALYSENGEPLYIGQSFSDTISGRGNSTWNQEKKPYTLTFSKPQKLFGSSPGEKWVLLANYLDQSNIRNYLFYQLARNTTDEIWNPDCEFVDLYLNGDYAGQYLLCEKIEAAEGKIRLSDKELLLSLDLSVRLTENRIPNVFTGISAELRSPKYLSEKKLEDYGQQLKEIIQTVRSGTASEAYLAEHVDLKSWAWKYVLEEVSDNFDSGACSQYLSFDGEIIRSQSAWDYDNTLGLFIHKSPGSFLADRIWKDDYSDSPWFHWLLQYDCFRALVTEQYEAVFHSKLNAMVQGGIEQLTRRIEASAAMDETKWPDKYSYVSWTQGVEQVRSFLAERLDFLNSAWLDGRKYHMVCLKNFPQYLYFSVADGMPFEELPDADRLEDIFRMYSRDAEMSWLSGWIDEETGQPFDPSQSITHDMVLQPVFIEPVSDTEADDNVEAEASDASGMIDRLLALYQGRRKHYVNGILIPFASLLMVGGILWLRDRRLFSRKKAGKKHGTKVSP